MVKHRSVSAGDPRGGDSIPGWEDLLVEEMATTPVLLPGKFHSQRNWRAAVHKESDTTEP